MSLLNALIKGKAEKGNFCLELTNLPQNVIDTLKYEGYDVTSKGPDENSIYTDYLISW